MATRMNRNHGFFFYFFYFQVAMTKYLTRSHLREEEVILAYSSRGEQWRGMGQEQETRQSHDIHSQEAKSKQEVEPGYKISRPTSRDSLFFHQGSTLPPKSFYKNLKCCYHLTKYLNI